MADEQNEVLVFVEHGDYDTVIRELHAVATVTQLLPPRLALVAVTAGAGAGPRDIAGTDWYADDVPADVFDGLSEQERLFVDAWRSRRFVKERPGDKLPWDATGFEPPDAPRGNRDST